MNFKYKKPQINADEHRYFPASEFSKTTHRKERKATQQKSLCSLFPLWLIAFSTQAHERAPLRPAPVIHLRTSRAGG
jgi:hypothetical protein